MSDAADATNRNGRTGKGRRNATASEAPATAPADLMQFVSITEETRRRYLNYAMSVIMSRALPDVRDGLKPVQRRLVYDMFNDLRLTSDAKYTKCARIVGDTTGKYHPHGGLAVYEALARMAQDFTLRDPLIDFQGNVGSIHGLPPAADRYTEARLKPIAEQLLEEIRSETVPMRPTYDGTRDEPVVLPARFPNLLVNGAQGIAVGMATNMPPHNLGEVIKACIHLIEAKDATVAQIMKLIKGPDFPLGGRIVTDRTEMRQMYEEGRGSIKVRAEYKIDVEGRREIPNRLWIYSLPYGVETGPLMQQLGEIRDSRKLPQMVDASDLTGKDFALKIVIELKSPDDAEAVMAYLYKQTSLEQNFAYNATCLIPADHGAMVPKRCSLIEILQEFLEFRFDTVRKRLEFDLRQLLARIHILTGFEIIFNGLEKALKLIRQSLGRQDAAQRLVKAFALDDAQALAVVDLQLYKISQLEIDEIREQLATKRAEAERLKTLLKSEKKLWGVVQTELEELATRFATPRRTSLGSAEEIVEYDAQAYIVKENTQVVVSTEGWIRRVGKISSVDKLRMREGDSVLQIVPGSTLDHVVIFSSDGTAYTLPIEAVPASTGYGEPLAKFARTTDGARMINAITTDPRITPASETSESPAAEDAPPPGPHLFVATARGQVLRIPFGWYRTPSTKNGRRYCRLIPGDRVVHVEFMAATETVFLISKQARLLHFAVSEVPILAGPGKGVRGIKLDKEDELLGVQRLGQPSDQLRVINENDKELTFGQQKYAPTRRAGRGARTSARTRIVQIIRPEITVTGWADAAKHKEEG